MATFDNFTAKPQYLAFSIFGSLALGVIAGFAIDRIFAKEEACEGDYCEPNEMEDEEDTYKPPKLYEVEGIDDKAQEKKVNDVFVKPDINSMTDYTKYFAKNKNYNKTDIPKEPEEPENGEDWSVIITREEFLKSTGNEDGYVSVTGGYFPSDGILAGWNEDLVEKDPHETVGKKAIDQFDDSSVKVVYVRNTKDKVLYEIIRYDDSFEDVVNETKTELGDGGMA